MSIWEGPMLGFDLETTGVNEYEDRMVTYSLILDVPGMPEKIWANVVNPGVLIPEEATKIHGISDAIAYEQGVAPVEALAVINGLILHAAAQHIPVVAFNASFDLTMLNAECSRYGVPPLPTNFGPVLDPHVIDKGVDKYRKGKRNLGATAAHYGVPLIDAHTSTGDVRATLGVCRAIGQLPGAAGATLQGMYEKQVGWRREQQTSYQEYLTRQGKADVLDPGWPFLEGAPA